MSRYRIGKLGIGDIIADQNKVGTIYRKSPSMVRVKWQGGGIGLFSLADCLTLQYVGHIIP